MREEIVLILMLASVGPSTAALQEIALGPYNISFDLNTTSEYSIDIEGASAGMSPEGVGFRRYNLTIDGTEGFAFVVLTEYDTDMNAGIRADLEVVAETLTLSACDQPKLYQPLIDGKPGVLGGCRYPSGNLLVVASYSPDGTSEGGQYRAKTNCRVLSVFPWEITRDMLYTLHIERT